MKISEKTMRRLREDYLLNAPVIDIIEHEQVEVDETKDGLIVDFVKAKTRLFALIDNPAVYENGVPKGYDACAFGDDRYNIIDKFTPDYVTCCHQYVYVKPMPPQTASDIVRLGETCCEIVKEHYTPGYYSLDEIRTLMTEHAFFGAVRNGNIVGFIGMHGEGSMGLLEVFPEYRRRGIGEQLEKYAVAYVMSCGRLPYAHVIVGNDVSERLQERCGLETNRRPVTWFGKKSTE